MKSIKLSIICPVYNAEHFIPNLIESVLKQTYQNWELILVNDGSTDATRKAIECFSDDKRIVLENHKNSGPSTARNTGIALATGTWITFVDADDTISINYLQYLLDGITDEATVDLVCGGYYECNDRFPNGIALHDFQLKFPNSVISQQEFTKNLFYGVTGVLWAKLFRYSIIKENNLKLHPKLKLSEDLLFVLQYAKHIKSVAIVYENIYYYNRIHMNGLSGKMDATSLSQIALFNTSVLSETKDEEKQFMHIILNNRTSESLMKLLKDQCSSIYQLKLTYAAVCDSFGRIESSGLNNENLIIASFLNKKKYLFAYLIIVLLRKIRQIRHV